ncbi:MAG: hypothetical protein ABI823_14485 [Bryobacteraceae bacterium]
MNDPKQPGPSAEDLERILPVFEPMRDKFDRLAASIPPDARPAVTFEALPKERP